MGPYHRFLPENLRRAALRAACHLDGIAEFLGSATLSTRDDEAPGLWGQM